MSGKPSTYRNCYTKGCNITPWLYVYTLRYLSFFLERWLMVLIYPIIGCFLVQGWACLEQLGADKLWRASYAALPSMNHN